MSQGLTPSQTAGPFFSIGLVREGMNDLTARGPAGQTITIEGQVLDGDRAPVADALAEIWQADASGRYPASGEKSDENRDSNFHGFGRCGTDAQGRFRFRTIKPGAVREAATVQAPHINVSVFARGLLNRLVTRIYFPDEPLNAHDPVLNSVTDPQRRATLIANAQRRAPEPVFRFDIILQGANETVFFDV